MEQSPFQDADGGSGKQQNIKSCGAKYNKYSGSASADSNNWPYISLKEKAMMSKAS
jgi:hypothetical protein